MPRLRVHNLSISVDGYAAGPGQDLAHPLGVDGERLQGWVFATPTGRAMLGEPGADSAPGVIDRDRDRPDEQWTGWWGEDPPHPDPVFVLTSHPRPPLTMAGGTTFTFVTDGIEAALAQACAAAGDADVRLGGGADTVRQYLRAGPVDELHVTVVPVLLGGGERLYDAFDGGPAGLECVEFAGSPVTPRG
ncbi:RibD C-terminal domain-containing protein [Modestobacter sp. DSM 44400]|uniref:dihydrofolate reductase family protein n=1 Tax=Modestobacter sp. DSM 44400 TaxID=1550230 RepID=UPI00089B1D0F|nr:dihydrofolate reductase family protein [Modestobacter sp. DSM 44400]SDX94513.1 RibD C-terminal domain-containing protein [Modestobacter sp. DSM 44400]